MQPLFSRVERLLERLRRRRVVRVALVYAVVAWLLVQIAAVTFPHLRLPSWAVTLVIVLAALGFPLAVILAWAFDVTPGGVVRGTEEGGAGASREFGGLRTGVRVATALVLSGAAAGWLLTGVLEPVPVPDAALEQGEAGISVGVLRFEAVNGDSTAAILARGMSEELARRLARRPDLRPAGTLAMEDFGNGGKPMTVARSELGVGSVLAGTMARDPDGLRVEARLLQPGGEPLWSGTYERSLHQLPDVTDDIVERVAETLAPGGEPPPTRAVAADAFRYYLEGLALARGGSPDAATDRFRRAVGRDSSFAAAHASLGRLYLERDGLTGPDDTVSLPQARHFARQAVRLDSTSAEGHAVLGRIAHLHELSWERAESRLRRAVRHAPGSVEAHLWYSELLSTLGRGEEAVKEARRARELAPRSARTGAALGRALLCARRRQEAGRRLRTVLERHPDHVPTRLWLAATHLADGDDAGTLAVLRAGLVDGRSRAFPGLSTVVGRVLNDSVPADVDSTAAPPPPGSPEQAPRVSRAFWTAVGYAALERPDPAFRWLERAHRDREPALRWLAAMPLLEPLREDPRYRSLVERLGFPRQD